MKKNLLFPFLVRNFFFCSRLLFDNKLTLIQYSCSATNYIVARRQALAHVHGTNFHHRFVAFILLLLSNVNLRHFYIITLFNSHC